MRLTKGVGSGKGTGIMESMDFSAGVLLVAGAWLGGGFLALGIIRLASWLDGRGAKEQGR